MITLDVLFNYFVTGMGVATGTAFTELYIKPHLKNWKKKGKKINDMLKGKGDY